MTMTKFGDIKHIDSYDSWFEMWYCDKKHIIELMLKNIVADLDAGYNYFGNSIQKALKEKQEYENKINESMQKFVYMDEKQIEKYCYYDLLKCGVIE